MSIAESDAAFFTALVGDFKSDSQQYLGFIATGGVAVPAAIMKYAPQFRTYTDDSYTTLLANSDVNVSELRSFASELPWYTRIVAEENATTTGGTDDSSATDSAEESQASETGSAGSAVSSIASNLSSRASAATSAAGSAAASSGSSSAAGSVIYAPMGIVALAAMALL